MSAFMCSDEHISALACYAAQDNSGNAETIARMLHRENALSLTAQYGDPDDPPFEFRPVSVHRLAPIRVIKAAQCYAYQACEHEGWAASQAREIINEIVALAASKLPGYEAAPWGSPV